MVFNDDVLYLHMYSEHIVTNYHYHASAICTTRNVDNIFLEEFILDE